MVNLVITQDRKVTGDNGKIIAYEGQDWSEIINIIHPQYPGCKYFIEYKYNNTIYKNELDANGHVSLKVENSGYLKCQFLAINIANGDIEFSSYPWNLIIKESLKTEAEHYPCNSINHTYCHHHEHANKSCSCNSNCDDDNFNAYEAYGKLKMAIENESDIRFNEMQNVINDIAEIKKYLHLDDTTASKIDADLMINEGIWYANNLSVNFPEQSKAYKLVVTKYNDINLLQHAYETNSTNIYYRSATISDDNYVWNNWVKLDVASN